MWLWDWDRVPYKQGLPTESGNSKVSVCSLLKSYCHGVSGESNVAKSA